jgi:hypothetical protein
MGRKFLTTPTLPTLSSAPSSASVGDMYFDTTQGKIGVYTTSGWVYLSEAAGSGGARIFQTTIGNGTNSIYTITHNFNTTNVEVSLTLLSTNEKIGAKVEVLNSNQVRVSFISPIATNSVKVVVIG